MRRARSNPELASRGFARPSVWLLGGTVAALVLAVVLAGRSVLWLGSPPPAIDYSAALHELAQRAQGLDRGGVDAWPLYSSIIERTVVAAESVSGVPIARTAEGFSWPVEFPSLIERSAADSDQARVALATIAQLEQSGVFRDLNRLAASPTAVRPGAPAGGLFGRSLFDLRVARHLIRAGSVRFARAYREGRENEAIAALQESLGLARVMGHQVTAIEWLTGVAAEALLLERVREEFAAKRPTPTMARAVLALLERPTTAPLEVILEGDRLVALDLLYSTLDDSPLRVSSRGAQMEKIEEFHEIVRAHLRAPGRPDSRRLRAQLDGFYDGLGKAYRHVGAFCPPADRFLNTADQLAALRAGTQVMVAIEGHMAEHGAAPAEIDQLAPVWFRVLPVDPFGSLVYRKVDPAADDWGWSYVLYSVGADRTDNGGKQHSEAREAALGESVKGRGFDFVFNSRRPRPVE